MPLITESCIAEDYTGARRTFAPGVEVRMHADNCPQVDGAVDTVRLCFYQETFGQHGWAAILNGHSWSYCRDLEVI